MKRRFTIVQLAAVWLGAHLGTKYAERIAERVDRIRIVHDYRRFWDG